MEKMSRFLQVRDCFPRVQQCCHDALGMFEATVAEPVHNWGTARGACVWFFAEHGNCVVFTQRFGFGIGEP